METQHHLRQQLLDADHSSAHPHQPGFGQVTSSACLSWAARVPRTWAFRLKVGTVVSGEWQLHVRDTELTEALSDGWGKGTVRKHLQDHRLNPLLAVA